MPYPPPYVCAQAPFRLPRIILFGSLLAGAAIGLLVILGRLAKSLQGKRARGFLYTRARTPPGLQPPPAPLLHSSLPIFHACILTCARHGMLLAGGPDAPELTESLTNLGVNVTAVVVLSFLLYRDVSAKQQAVRITNREEGLGRLQVGERWRRRQGRSRTSGAGQAHKRCATERGRLAAPQQFMEREGCNVCLAANTRGLARRLIWGTTACCPSSSSGDRWGQPAPRPALPARSPRAALPPFSCPAQSPAPSHKASVAVAAAALVAQVRPVIVAGSRGFVEKAIKDAETQYLTLRDRAVSGEPAARYLCPSGVG